MGFHLHAAILRAALGGSDAAMIVRLAHHAGRWAEPLLWQADDSRIQMNVAWTSAEIIMKVVRGILAVFLVSMLAGCGYNTIQQKDEAVKSAWAEVLSQYQRRADLIPNIVATVKGEADFEKTTLQNVIEARARATSIQATPELIDNPEAFAKFTQAQGQLTSALSRLLVTVENYPNLKANAGFQELRTQLEGTENRIGIARNRYIKSVEDFNTFIRQLPQNLTAMVFGYKPKPQFAVENEAAISKPPTVDFGAPKK
jgi:LemA protein